MTTADKDFGIVQIGLNTASIFVISAAVCLTMFPENALCDEIASFNEPLKSEYIFTKPGSGRLYRTEQTFDSYSIICAVGQAIPDNHREGWYVNKPIAGLSFEMRARLAIDTWDGLKPAGFAVFVKNGEILKMLNPLGEYENGEWNGDVFSTWSHSSSDIVIISESLGRTEIGEIDLLDGNGLFYKSDIATTPDYFLSGCRRIAKNELPVYDHEFSASE